MIDMKSAEDVTCSGFSAMLGFSLTSSTLVLLETLSPSSPAPDFCVAWVNNMNTVLAITKVQVNLLPVGEWFGYCGGRT